ncbi:MAG: alpha-hydroxy-acid oxidizing protein [Acidobacteriia bacterium]|nr:alpha-hydroxy-acid oxidizing protein [Terriglobia bacterium]
MTLLTPRELEVGREGGRSSAKPGNRTSRIDANRRRFLRFLAASPLVAESFAQEPFKITSPKDVLAVMDLKELAHSKLPPAHWGFLASGVDDDLTLQANIEAFKHIGLRPRRFVDVSKTDTRVEMFGVKWERPIYLSALGPQKLFHPDGELAAAGAARSRKALQMLSMDTSSSVEQVTQALGMAPWYQLYLPARWEVTERLLRRAESAGCSVLVWTVDGQGGRNLETSKRFARTDTRDCASCHASIKSSMQVEGGLNMSAVTWDYVDRLKKLTTMKLVIKGLDTGEDARMAVDRGADGIVVSNHGGRTLETLRPTIECLPEVVEAVGDRVPVFVDGGFRRGSDVYKALALGARAVGIGRPYIYGLTAFGQEGVERVLDIMNAELAMTMRQCGAPSIGQIKRSSVVLPDRRV